MTSLNKLDLPKLYGSDNYITWSIRIQALLIKEDLYEPIEKDSISGTNTKNRKALAIIKLLCDDSPLLYIRDEDNAKKAWQTLRDIYNPKGFTTEYLILKEFFNTNLSDFDSMENYLNKVKLLADDLKSKDIILPSQVIIAWILNSLNENYDGFTQNITQALRQNPAAYTVESLIKSLIDESRGKEENIYMAQAYSYRSRPNYISRNRTAKYNQKHGKIQKIWKKQPYMGKYCQNCNLTNHNTTDCFKLFPAKRPSFMKNTSFKNGQKQGSNPNFRAREAKKGYIRPNKDTIYSNKPSEYSLANQKQNQAIINAIINNSEDNSSSQREQDISNRYITDNSQLSLTSESKSPIITALNSEETKNNFDRDLDMIDFDISDNMDEVSSLLPNNNNISNYNTGYLNKSLYNYDITRKAVFIIDSGATVSAITKLDYFYTFKPINEFIHWGNNINIPVKYKGSIIIRSNKNYIYILHNVLYIPKLGLNILSLPKLNNNITIFTSETVSIYRDNQITMIGYKENNLYKTWVEILYPNKYNPKKRKFDQINTIGYKNISKDVISAYIDKNNKKPFDIYLWHIKLGHIGIKPLSILLNIDILNISSTELYKLYSCKTCQLAKDRRYINKESLNKRPISIGERIHSDIGGPIEPKTYNNFKYYITFIDKKSRYLWVKLIKNKAEALSIFNCIKNNIENQKDIKIKELFTDNGKEYINNRFKVYLNKYGIIHRKTPIYTKEPNGLIERINLTLLNKVRAMLIYSKAPLYLWGEAILAACYIYNRTPHSSINFKTPYEIYWGSKPNINNIKIWGSIVYYNTNKQLTKLAPRREQAILVGYAEDYYHYKLYIVNKRITIWSRDISIIENQFENYQKYYPNYPSHINFDISNKENILSKDISNKYKYNTRARANTIAKDPNHKIEIQIPKGSINTIYDKNTIYTISDTVIENQLSSINKSKLDFILSISNIDEPNTFKQAMESPDKNNWYKACLDENNELIKQNTFDIVNTPSNIKLLGGRWVFKMKPINKITAKSSYITNKDNTIRYKARWVVQGFGQRLGVDFLETFSTTCRTETWHMLLIIAINQGLYIWQYDVKNAFCHADIDTTIYTVLPIGLYNSPKYIGKCAKLNKALYGLKQSPRLWYNYLQNMLYKLNFTVLPYDEGVYINSISKCILICHVDDILVIHKDIQYIKDLSIEINKYIKLDELGLVSTFLGNRISIDYKNKKLYIDQIQYTKKLLSKFNIYDNIYYKPRDIPGEPGIKLQKNTVQASNIDIKEYQKQIGSLLYLALKTRPDITFDICNAARYMANPSKAHFKAINNIWRYLLANTNTGLILDCTGKNLYIKGYCDSDWGNNLDNRKSTSAYIFSLGNIGLNNPISWNSQLQKTIALSSCEAEYISLKEAIKEAIYLNNIFKYIDTKLGLNLYQIGYIPTILLDSESAKKLAENPEFHKRSKHIDIIYHFTRSAIQNKQVKLVNIPTKENIADILTKALSKPLFQSILSKFNIGEV